MTPHEQAKALADQLDIAGVNLRRAITVLDRSIATTQTLAADARRLADSLYPEPPARRTILVGPSLELVPNGSQLTRLTLHQAFGTEVWHGPIGVENLFTSEKSRALRHHTTGGGSSIIADRALAWFVLPGARNPKAKGHGTHSGYSNISAEYEIYLGERSTTGWQLKADPAVTDCYISGRNFPGGGFCFPGDAVLRSHINHYPLDVKQLSKGRHPLRHGIYLYTSDPSQRKLPGQVLIEPIHPSRGTGYRRLVLFDEGDRPVEEEWQRIGRKIERDPETGESLITVAVNGAEVWSGELVLPSPVNRTGISSAYGGTDVREGPTGPTNIHYRDVKVTVP